MPKVANVLMGAETPDGWKLEELLDKLVEEVEEKSVKVAHDNSLLSQTVQNHNLQIIGLLRQAQALQQQSMRLLDEKAPNEGATGTPRIG